ncbi:MAG: hypothetical protein HY718_09850, partial [Planctomycetes bacterium]|nr:hypothetical protein [Planctomycetota bacterium]
AQQRQQAKLPEDKPKVVADARSNALVIAANNEDFEAIARLVQQLQQLPLSPMQDIRQVILKYNDAGKLADIINKIFEERLGHTVTEGQKVSPSDKVFLTADPITNMLLVVSTKSAYDEVVRLISMLDVPPMVEGTLRTFFVKNTDVTQAAKMLDDLFQKGLFITNLDKQVPEAQKKVTIIPDIRSSALIVSASPENLSVVESVLKDIDRVDVPIFQADTQVVQLKHADPVQVAATLEDLMEGIRKALGDQGDQFQLTVIANSRINALILAGSRLAMKRAEEIIPGLDQPLDRMAYETKVYKLQQASASRLEGVLTTLFEKQVPSTEAQKKTPIIIIPDEPSSSLVISASRDMHQEVARLVERLDVPTQWAQQMEIITLERAKADQVVQTLQDLVKALPQQTGQSQVPFSVTADVRTNALVVFAAPDLMATVRDIVRRLDTTGPKQAYGLRVFKLVNAQAEDLSNLLDEFFKAAGTGEGQDLKQMIIKFTPVNPETGLPVLDPASGEHLLKTLVHQDVTVKPDKYTNSLLVMAPADNIDMMEMLVHMLDSIEPRTAKVQAFELRRADAEEMRKLLQDLFKPQGGQQGEGRQLVLTGGESGGAAGGGELEVLFAVDRRTNTLVAAGTPAQLRIVESLVYRLDDQDIEERTVRVVPLQYAKSDDVATTLTSFFQSESQLISKAEEGAAAARQLQREVTIESGGESSNTLLISYSPRLESQIVTMVNELDRPPPQVMIQVLMA